MIRDQALFKERFLKVTNANNGRRHISPDLGLDMDQVFSYGGYKLPGFAEKWVLKNSKKYPYSDQ